MIRRLRLLPILFAVLALSVCAAHATIKWTNNATSIINDAGGISAGATSMTVYTGHGDRFPAVSSPHYFMVTLVDTSGNREIVKVTARTSGSNTMTIVRAQESTTAQAFAQGSLVELRITKNALDYLSKSADIHEGWYVADYSAADQGAVTNSNSIKSLVTTIGATKEAYIFLPNANTTGDSTVYTVSTDLTVTDNIVLVIPKGSYITPDSGKTVTLAAPPQAGPYQIFDGDGTVTVTGYPQEQAWSTGGTSVLSMLEGTVGGVNIGNGLSPPGSMLPYAGSTAPTGWLLCYGQAVSRTTYATLFGIISTTYGVGDGSTTFNVPDMRGRAAIGLDNLGGSAASRVAAATSLGQAAGAETHKHTISDHWHTTPSYALTEADLPANITATISTRTSAGPDGTKLLRGSNAAEDADVSVSMSSVGSGTAHSHGNTGLSGAGDTSTVSNLSPYLAMSWIIKL